MKAVIIYYSFAEKRVLLISSGGGGEGFELVGSSHGWVALFNSRNNDLLLSNPLSGRRITLPRIEILGEPTNNLKVIVLKVILSSSPDEEEEGCRAMMTYAVASMWRGSRVAFCSPGRSWRWTQISNMNSLHSSYTFEDLVYCNTRRVLSCITAIEFVSKFFLKKNWRGPKIVNWDFGNPLMDDWNMGNPEIDYWDHACPPKKVWKVQKDFCFEKEEKGKTPSWAEEYLNLMKHHHCTQIPHLVYAEEFDQLYLATRFVSSGRTLGFVVLKVRRNGRYEVVNDLNGLVMFVGINHSIAVPASRFPELKSNSIYFTDAKRLIPGLEHEMLYCANDTGIFDYESKTITPIITGNEPHHSSPIWFYFYPPLDSAGPPCSTDDQVGIIEPEPNILTTYNEAYGRRRSLVPV